MSDETCRECGRPYAVDDWWWSPDCEHLCGSKFHDADEDATGELECRGFTIQTLRTKLADAERRLAQAERVVEAARRVSVDNAFIRALPELDDELERYDVGRAKLGTVSDA